MAVTANTKNNEKQKTGKISFDDFQLLFEFE